MSRIWRAGEAAWGFLTLTASVVGPELVTAAGGDWQTPYGVSGEPNEVIPQAL